MIKSLTGYDLNDLYNMDETTLFYKLQPNSTLSTTTMVSGQKSSKERITIGLCSNASGTHKLKPIVIAKCKG